MATRKDLLKAHSFTSQRLVNALVSRNPDDPNPPLRRVRTGTLIGALIGVLVTAGFGVWGLLDPGSNKSWKADGTVVVDTSSGVTYVYLTTEEGKPGALHQTPNLASARLAAGTDDVKVVRVSGRSLADEPRGVSIGIPAAPRVLPEAKQLRTFPLRACTGQAGKQGRATTLELGAPAPGPENAPVLLANEQGDLVLVLAGVAHPMPNNRTTPPGWLTKLRFIPLSTSQAFIDTLPLGVPLTRIKVAGEGEPFPGLGAVRVGSIGAIDSPDGQQWWVLQQHGFSQITWIDAQLMLADQVPQIPNLDVATVTQHLSKKESKLGSGNIPDGVPRPAEGMTDASSVCATWTKGATAPTIQVNVSGLPDVAQPNPRSRVADKVVVAPGRGAVLQSTDVLDAKGAAYLVVDGKRYAVPTSQDRAALGYAAAPDRVPASVIALIPDGLPEHGVLSRAQARYQLP